MGFLDEASNLLNRGVANAGRGTRSLSIKAQLNDLKKQREELCRQLGAALYEQTRNDPECRKPHEPLYAAIDALDVQSSSLHSELAAIEQQAHLSQAGALWRCPACASPVGSDDAFCVNCGMRVGPPDSPQASSRFCRICGAPLEAGVRFCVGCGAPADPEPAPVAEHVADATPPVPLVPPAPPVPLVPPAQAPAPCAPPAPADAPADNASAPQAVGGAEAASANSDSVHASAGAADCPTVVMSEEASDATQIDPAGVTQMIDAVKPPAPPVSPMPPAPSAPMPKADTSGVDRMADSVAPMPPAPPAPAFVPIGQQAGLCSNCGYENVSDAVFCRNCGQKL